MTWQRVLLYIAIALIALVAVVLVYTVIKWIIRFIRWLRARHAVSLSVNDKWLVDEFSRCNVIVFGKKRTGKDLLFSHVIALRGQKHYANIPYNGNTEVRPLSDLSVGSNTWKDLLHGTIEKMSPQFDEGTDFYVSDGGIYLPSQYDTMLNELYPSMPIFYALSGQLYGMNVHVNSQELGRIWIKLREQADSYIRILRSKKTRDGIYIEGITYDNYAAANAKLLPRDDPDFIAKNGEIVRRRWFVPYSEIQYNTRHFRDVFLERELTPLELIQQRLTDFKARG